MTGHHLAADADAGRRYLSMTTEKDMTSMDRKNAFDIETIRGQALQSFFAVFEQLAEGAFIVDADCNIVWSNAHYLAFVGLGSEQAVVGKKIEDVVSTTRMPEVVRTGRSIPFDIIEINQRWSVVSRFPIKNDAQEVIGGFCFVLSDELDPLRPMLNRIQQLQAELELTRSKLSQMRRSKYEFNHFVGTSAAALEVKLQARQVAATDSTVLLQGETGTGKEMVAQGIHAASWRADQNFVAVNVAAIPEDLMEAEFFGVAPGAYTGASPKGRVGKMMLANNGTLFLDEIGDMPIRMQVKLLRALQEREIEPVGTNTVIRLNLRVIAASSLDLGELVKRGQFRADLFYRLSVVPISIPPLRERLDDLPGLTRILVADVCASLGISGKSLDLPALERLQGHAWPGNVRELRNVLERASIVAGPSPVIRAEHILLNTATTPPLAPGRGPLAADLYAAVSDVERIALSDALHKTGGNKAAAARELGISRSTLYAKLKQLNMV